MELNELEKIVMDMKEKLDTVLSQVDESEKNYQHEKGVAEFTERNKDALEKYSDKLKKLNGDSFDIFSAAYDEYNNDFTDIEEAAYVTQLVNEIDSKLAKLKEALNEDEVEVKSDEEDTTVETDSTEVTVPSEDDKSDEDHGSDNDESDNDESDNDESDNDESDNDEEEEFERLLDEDYAIYKD